MLIAELLRDPEHPGIGWRDRHEQLPPSTRVESPEPASSNIPRVSTSNPIGEGQLPG
jgi:hypothetical protein